MSSLAKDLQSSKKTIAEFFDITIRLLHHLPNVVSNTLVKNDYKILTSNIAGTIKFFRPINKNLLIENCHGFKLALEKVFKILEKLKKKDNFFEERKSSN
jgi:hypothetical protein